MKFQRTSLALSLTLTFCIAVTTSVLGMEAWQNNVIARQANGNEMKVLKAVRNEVKVKGCNLNLCFVLDGTNAVTKADFDFQKNFVDLVVAITATDRPATFCAYQYGQKAKQISSLARNRVAFLNRVKRARKVYGRPHLEPALRRAIQQVYTRTHDANKVLIFSKNKPIQVPRLQPLINRFFRRRGGFCSVALKNNNIPNLTRLLKNRNLVFPQDGFFEVSEIITGVVHMVCGME